MPRLNTRALLLTSLYLLLTALLLYCVTYLLSKYFSALANLISWGIALAFLFTSVSGLYWNTALFLSNIPVRKPIQDELLRIEHCLAKLKDRSHAINHSRFRIVLLNTVKPEAFAVGRKSICLSFGMLCISNDEELCAVIAHEAGHILSYDTVLTVMFVSAYNCSTRLNAIVRNLVGKILQFPLKLKLVSILSIIVSAIFQPLLTRDIIFALLLGSFVLRLLNCIASKLHLYVSRLTEYQRDAFVSSIGLGEALKMILLKLYFLHPTAGATTWDLIHRCSHPILHHRIRALEKLDALRE